MFCYKCGAHMNDEDLFCGNCGAQKLHDDKNVTDEIKKPDRTKILIAVVTVLVILCGLGFMFLKGGNDSSVKTDISLKNLVTLKGLYWGISEKEAVSKYKNLNFDRVRGEVKWYKGAIFNDLKIGGCPVIGESNLGFWQDKLFIVKLDFHNYHYDNMFGIKKGGFLYTGDEYEHDSKIGLLKFKVLRDVLKEQYGEPYENMHKIYGVNLIWDNDKKNMLRLNASGESIKNEVYRNSILLEISGKEVLDAFNLKYNGKDLDYYDPRRYQKNLLEGK